MDFGDGEMACLSPGVDAGRDTGTAVWRILHVRGVKGVGCEHIQVLLCTNTGDGGSTEGECRDKEFTGATPCTCPAGSNWWVL